MVGTLRVMDYSDAVNEKGSVFQSYTVDINSFHVSVSRNERGTGRKTCDVVFARDHSSESWLDDDHSSLTDCLAKFENALLALVEKVKKGETK